MHAVARILARVHARAVCVVTFIPCELQLIQVLSAAGMCFVLSKVFLHFVPTNGRSRSVLVGEALPTIHLSSSAYLSPAIAAFSLAAAFGPSDACRYRLTKRQKDGYLFSSPAEESYRNGGLFALAAVRSEFLLFALFLNA